MRKGTREKFRMLKRAGRPPQGIQLTVMVTFMMVSLILMLSTSLVLYQRFAMSYPLSPVKPTSTATNPVSTSQTHTPNTMSMRMTATE